MKHLKLFEDINSFEFQEDWEEEDKKVKKKNIYPGGEELFGNYPIGTRVMIKKWIDGTRDLTGTVIGHRMHDIKDNSVFVGGVSYNVFPELTIRTDTRVVIPDYRGFDDTYTNIINIGTMDIDAYSEKYGWSWIKII